jgi:thiol-disulfide isomerase/thioredoxin
MADPPATPAPAPGASPPAGPPRPRRPWRRLALDALLVLAVVAAVGLWQTRSHLGAGTAPALALTALDGRPASLEALRGKPVLVAFWAPWCAVCSAQSDNLSRVRRWAAGRAHVISVAAAYGDDAEVRDHVARKGIDYPVWLGGDDAARAFRVEVFPTIYFLDAEGRVKGSVAGYTTTLGMLARLLL